MANSNPNTYDPYADADWEASSSEGLGGYTPQEMGYPGVPPKPPGALPPGGGRYTVPNFLSFSALVRSAAKAFLYSSDEALRDSPTNARAMLRDPVLWGALLRVWRPIAQLPWVIEPDDETNPAEVEAAKLMEYVVRKTPHFQRLKMHLLRSHWYGKYGVEIDYEWRSYRGEEKLFVRDFLPVNGDKLRLKWDTKTWGVLVYSGYPGDKVSTDWGLCHFLTPEERLQYVIHQYEPEDADWLEPEMAGSIGGVGVRGKLYWFWWLKQQVFGQLMNYIHRFANGLTIFYYDASNPQAQQQAVAAARQQFSNVALLYPRWSGVQPDVNKVERLEVGTANSALIWNLVSEYFDPIMERFIEGQTLTTKAESNGIGTGAADAHGETNDEIVKYHAIGLQETMQKDFIEVLYAYNAPGVPPGNFSFSIDDPNTTELMEHGDMLYNWGVPLDEDQVYEVSQWRKPKMGGGVVSQVGQMSPQMGAPGQPGQPMGVPQAGAPGPMNGQPGQEVAQMSRRIARERSREALAHKPRRSKLQRKRVVFA